MRPTTSRTFPRKLANCRLSVVVMFGYFLMALSFYTIRANKRESSGVVISSWNRMGKKLVSNSETGYDGNRKKEINRLGTREAGWVALGMVDWQK